MKIIAGPTASGKTGYAIAQARQDNGVIINADSVQLYDALPVLSARPTPDEQAQVPHRLFAALPPAEKCSAARWRDLALRETRAALAQGRTPYLVGGTGFYLKTFIEGLAPIPDIPDEIRSTATALLHEKGHEAFHDMLKAHDPVMAARLHKNDTQRLIRAWEVLQTTGKSLSWWQDQPLTGAPQDLIYDITILCPPRPALYERCERRFDLMMAGPVLDEVRLLSAQIDQGHVPADAPITNALGFRELNAHIKGQYDLTESITQAKTITRRYAKRQQTWFRHQFKSPAAQARIACLSFIDPLA